MPTIKLTGILTDVFPLENVNPNFAKKVFWVKQAGNERYLEHWEFELHNQDTGRLKGFEVGDTVEAEIEVKGRKWQTKVGDNKIFTSLKCVGLARLAKLEADGYKSKPGKQAANEQDLPF